MISIFCKPAGTTGSSNGTRSTHMDRRLAGTGIWSGELRYGDPGAAADAAGELEELGYSALWVPDIGGDVFGAVDNLLRATRDSTVATGILNLWMHEAAETASEHARLAGVHGDRFLVGIGVSHQPLIDRSGAGTYERPMARMRAYLDALDVSQPALATEDRVLAALGPRMLELARLRSAGAHPYLVTPEHTAQARDILGPEALLAPEQAVVVERDPARARAIGREGLSGYLGLPNYVRNWMRWGFEERDVENGGSDRLVDAMVAWGDEATIAERVAAHRRAGADHVCIQVLGAEASGMPMEQWRRLAPALTDHE